MLMVSALVLVLAGAGVLIAAGASGYGAGDSGRRLGAFLAEERAWGFPIARTLALMTAVALTIWAFRRTWADVRQMPPEWRGTGAPTVYWLIVALVACTVIEAQAPLILAVENGLNVGGWGVIGDNWTQIVAVVGGVSSAVTFFSRYLGGVLKSAKIRLELARLCESLPGEGCALRGGDRPAAPHLWNLHRPRGVSPAAGRRERSPHAGLGRDNLRARAAMARRYCRGAGSRRRKRRARSAEQGRPHTSVRSIWLVLLGHASHLPGSHRSVRRSPVRRLAANLCARSVLSYARAGAVVPHMVPVRQCELHTPPLSGPPQPSVPFRPSQSEI